MSRREFIALLGSALAAWPVAARAQTAGRLRRIGVLSNSAEADAEGTKRLAAFRLRLQELGWTEGKNLQIDVRLAYTDAEHVRQAAAELTGIAPDAIVSTTSTTTRALMNATGNIPIVAAVSGDSIALGFTKNLSNPTGNITGFTTFNDTLAAKPAMHSYAFETNNGALLSYGIDNVENFRRAAEYADRILKGTRIADLPFQEPTRLTLAINLRTARTIGVKVPPTLVALADEVTE